VCSSDLSNVPGPSAFAVTDADGRYSAKLMGEDKQGATVGKNIVRFAGYVPVDPTYDGPAKTKPKTNVPPKYQAEAAIEFNVPPKGTSSADFQLTSP